ncbi:DUF111 family protein [Blautia schinkii]|nr:DUF111 family protein [Blautia schinkii]
MQIYSKNGVILYVQADHLPGEILGSVIDYLYEAGACNVQVIPTVTKKNRPGYIFLIDTKEDYAEAVERVLIRELKVTGWHRISTEHRHLAVDYVKKQIQIQGRDFAVDMELEGKVAHGECVSLRPEHRSCARMKELLKERGYEVSLVDCGKILTQLLEQNESIYIIQEER